MKFKLWQALLATALVIVGGGMEANAQSATPAGSTYNLSIGPGASEGLNIPGKSYSVGGMIRISGNVSTSISNPDKTISASVDQISNDSTTATSGALRLRLFLTTTPFAEGVAYYTLGETGLNPLPPQSGYTNFAATMALMAPQDGIYYLNIGIFEQEQGCAATDAFCPDSTGTYASRVQVQGGVVYAYPEQAETTAAVEYYHPAFNHYFFTAIADEIAKLDAGLFAGWQRTGRTFGVWNFNVGSQFAVCRFFSESFAPKSSHFYTPVSTECALVKSNPAWEYEGVVAYWALPSDDGTCSTGIPLYRLYNDGIGGAPNHRYTTSLAVRTEMINAGWIPEGSGIGVIGCVPY